MVTVQIHNIKRLSTVEAISYILRLFTPIILPLMGNFLAYIILQRFVEDKKPLIRFTVLISILSVVAAIFIYNHYHIWPY